MNADTMLTLAGEITAPWTVEARTPEANRLDIVVDASNLLPAIQALAEAGWGYLTAITGLDSNVASGSMEVLYHFCEGAAVLTLRVSVPRDNASVPSICGVLPAASFYERELREMFGIRVDGLGGPDHLFLPDDWQDGIFPLRKDARLTNDEVSANGST
jgi:Ni,Fe-hydrogenase III component G